MRGVWAIAVIAIAALPAASAADDRFGDAERADYRAGFAGDQNRLDRGMKASEDILAANPKHAEALVWHGAAQTFLAGQAFQNGDAGRGMDLFGEGNKAMDDAVALEPNNVRVLWVRGTTLLTASKMALMPRGMALPLIEKGIGDYEKTLTIEKSTFAKRDSEYKGQLLSELADAWERLGKHAKARSYYARVVKEVPGSDDAAKANQWLADHPEKSDETAK